MARGTCEGILVVILSLEVTPRSVHAHLHMIACGYSVLSVRDIIEDFVAACLAPLALGGSGPMTFVNVVQLSVNGLCIAVVMT